MQEQALRHPPINKKAVTVMPSKPMKPCKQTGCAALTHNRFCDKHKKERQANYDRYDRDPLHNKRYNAQWRSIRLAFLHEHPLCENCKQQGKLTPATLVHHDIPLRNGGGNEPGNLKALCWSCHSEHHMRERRAEK
jgi:5-methylcytosine-specific restriction protein A